MTTYTTNQNYPKPDFDTEPFIDVLHTFADMVDEDIAALTQLSGAVVEVWDNSVDYTIGDHVYDDVIERLYVALATHTSSSSGTFAEDRETNPGNWDALGIVLVAQGAWAQNTAYAVLDHVYDEDEGVSAICLVSHTSTTTGTIRTDAANWVFIVDVQASLTAAVHEQLILEHEVFGA